MYNDDKFKTIKNIRYTAIKNMRNRFRLKKENEVIKDRVIRYIRNLFQHAEEDYCNPVRVGNFWSNNYIEQESNSDRNKSLSIEEYLIKTVLKRRHK